MFCCLSRAPSSVGPKQHLTLRAWAGGWEGAGLSHQVSCCPLDQGPRAGRHLRLQLPPSWPKPEVSSASSLPGVGGAGWAQWTGVCRGALPA